METTPAKITAADVIIEDHGLLALDVCFDYGGSGQGLGNVNVDAGFIRCFLEAVGCRRLRDAVGRVVLVTHSWEHISRIAPMPFDRGEPFDIDAYVREVNR